MSTDETPPASGSDDSTPGARAAFLDRLKAWRPDRGQTRMIAVAAAALVVGFGGGILAGKAGELGWFGGNKSAVASAPVKGQAWSLFGKPRSASARVAAFPSPKASPSGKAASTAAAPTPWPACG